MALPSNSFTDTDTQAQRLDDFERFNEFIFEVWPSSDFMEPFGWVDIVSFAGIDEHCKGSIGEGYLAIPVGEGVFNCAFFMMYIEGEYPHLEKSLRWNRIKSALALAIAEFMAEAGAVN